MQNVIEHYEVKGTPYKFHDYMWVRNFNPFHSMASHFISSYICAILIETTKRMDDLKGRAVHTIRAKVPHICIYQYPRSQNFRMNLDDLKY